MTATLDMSINRFAVLDGLESAQARVSQRLRFILGEWAFDQTLGVPYFTLLLGRRLSPALIAQEIAAEASKVEGVERIDIIDFTVSDDRTLTVVLDVEADDGQAGTIEVQIDGTGN